MEQPNSPLNLKLENKTWVVTIRVAADLQGLICRSRLMRSTKGHDMLIQPRQGSPWDGIWMPPGLCAGTPFKRLPGEPFTVLEVVSAGHGWRRPLSPLRPPL
jgi:hypothetical protein